MTASSAARLIENIVEDVLATMEYGEALECAAKLAANFAKRLRTIESYAEPAEAPKPEPAGEPAKVAFFLRDGELHPLPFG